jgi:hypothetical protein
VTFVDVVFEVEQIRQWLADLQRRADAYLDRMVQNEVSVTEFADELQELQRAADAAYETREALAVFEELLAKMEGRE